MATLVLPMPSSPSETQRVSLDGTEYSVVWRWNGRDEHWTVSFNAVDGTPLTSGLRVVIGFDLLIPVSNVDAPRGELFFFDLSTSDAETAGIDPGIDDLGDRVQGFYVEPEAA